jgi:hypothetical protein
MDLQYYFQYILSWIYHNVIYTDAAFAVLRIILFIGLVCLLVYREYTLFVLLCIVVIAAEGVRFFEAGGGGSDPIWSWMTEHGGGTPHTGIDKDELTTGVSMKEGFSLGWLPKIIEGDATGKDHRRPNKFMEEDSNDFTDKYFKSKQCSIGTGAGSITMFGSNELIGESRSVKLSGIYDFSGKINEILIISQQPETGQLLYKYFKDCVYDPVYRSIRGMEDFRITKKQMYNDINNHIINIDICLKRFNTEVLFNTVSDITADKSKRISLSDSSNNVTTYTITGNVDTPVTYVSLITGKTNAEKMKNIQQLTDGATGDNASDQTYRNLITRMNSDERYKNKDALKQKHLSVYTKVNGYRKRIDEILSMMRTQTKNDSTLLYTIRVDEAIIQELRMMLSYLAIIQRTNDIIVFEENLPASTGPIHKPTFDPNNKGIYNMLQNDMNGTPKYEIEHFIFHYYYKRNEPILRANSIMNNNRIYIIPLDDDTYNTSDEKRYLYGIAFYFNKAWDKMPTD